MAFVRRLAGPWQLRTRSLALGARTVIMGVVNVTPDSFSDGGLYLSAEAATAQALALLDEGADLLDVGGESTRPGLTELTVSAQEEQDRILPVIEAVLRERPSAVLSVDTYKAETARAAVAAGAAIVNDISGLAWDAEMASVCAELGCGVVLMHTRGRPPEWRTLPPLADSVVVPLVREGLAHSLEVAARAGIERRRIVLDPGYGFGKIFSQNHPLLAHQDELLGLGQPLLAGVSRKSFLGRILSARTGAAEVPAGARGNATLAATTAAILAGASIVRVHEVRPALEAAAVADAILAAV
jgi:dihydropteroate synthase